MQGIATTTINDTAPYDAGAARRGLVRGVLTALLATAAALACVTVLLGGADWWRGYAAATVTSALAAGLSLIPLLKGLDKGFSAFVPAVMVATGIRTVIAVGGCILAITAGHYPATPTLMLMMPYYFALLSVETMTLIKLGKK